MTILFLAHRAPSAPDRGDRIRSYHVLRHLAARSSVHVVALDEGDPPCPDLPLAGWTIIRRTKGRARALVHALGTGHPVSLTAFDDAAMAQAIRTVRHDIVYCFSGQMAQHVPVSSPFVMDFVDVDSAKFAQLAEERSGIMARLYAREARLLGRIERDVAGRAEACLFVSEAEAELFRQRGGRGRIEAVGNGIDAATFDPAIVRPADGAAGQGPLVVFTGQMDYEPNVEACRWFVGEVMPTLPDLRLAIVGRAPTAAVRALASERVTVTSEVPDTRPWLAAAAVCIAPLALARGIQNKVLEAMAMARPVLATPGAAEGIDHGGTIRVAPRERFAAALAELLASPGDLGVRARARVVAHYDWNARLMPLDTLFGLGRAAAA